jgi:hypothetical protein
MKMGLDRRVYGMKLVYCENILHNESMVPFSLKRSLGGKTTHLNILIQKSVKRLDTCPPKRAYIGQDG